MPSQYRSFGKTSKGDPRFQCKACKSTFSIGHSARRHKNTDKTGFIFRQLVNKGAINRIAEVAGVEFPHIYEKIDYLYEQCLIFAGEREQKLAKCFRDRSVYLSTDVQTLLVNWPVKNKRGTIALLHMMVWMAPHPNGIAMCHAGGVIDQQRNGSHPHGDYNTRG